MFGWARKSEEEWLRRFAHIDVKVQEYEEIKRSDRVDSAGRASYVERNQWMIDESDCCVLYFNEKINYKSGTKIVYEYAKQKCKQLLKLQDNLVWIVLQKIKPDGFNRQVIL